MITVKHVLVVAWHHFQAGDVTTWSGALQLAFKQLGCSKTLVARQSVLLCQRLAMRFEDPGEVLASALRVVAHRSPKPLDREPLE